VTSSMKRLLTDAILIIFDYSGTLSVQAPTVRASRPTHTCPEGHGAGRIRYRYARTLLGAHRYPDLGGVVTYGERICWGRSLPP